ncbi:MAG: hypothetical protein VKK62_06180 [Synechococcaceae cyanobacterium]|nr:hypothetical protein [Synechococcaceae cyanobacterium]
MRQHPISPVTEPTQYRAIGVVRGRYVPSSPDQLTRGVIHTADGSELEAVVLGRLLTLMRRYLDMAEPHLWVVYPRCREEGKLHLQMVGVWEPSTLDLAAADGPDSGTTAELEQAAPAAAEPEIPAASAIQATSTLDSLPEGDDYFSVRGELIFTRPETGDLVVKVRQQPRADGSRPTPFKLQLRGEIPLEHLRHFVALDMRRQGQQLCLEKLEVLAPISQRGNRGGKSRRSGERGGRSGGGAGEAGPRRLPPKGPGHARAIHRPAR